jgi:hypothetical protein
VFQPAKGGSHHVIERCHLVCKVAPSFSGNPVWLPPVLRRHRANPATLFQACDRAVQSARPKPDVRKPRDVFHYGVAVLFALGKTGEYE